MEEQSISIRLSDAVQMKDPLVLNFDGSEEQISLFSSHSGYLALDKNGDDIINDGNELFGAQSGNGFADLSAYDEDSNRWIDKADSIYSSLRIWSPDAEGNNQLFALGQKDIGAIYLGNISIPLDIRDGDNTLQGEVVSGGIFLK